MKAVIIYISVIVPATFWLSLYIAGRRPQFAAAPAPDRQDERRNAALPENRTLRRCRHPRLFPVSESLLHRFPAPTAGAPAETAAQVHLRTVGPVQHRTELNAAHFSSRLPNTT